MTLVDHFFPFLKWLLRKVSHALLGLSILSFTLVLLLRWVHPPTTSFILLYAPKEKKWIDKWAPYQNISSHLPIAVVAAEDQKFPGHWGFDFEAMKNAFIVNQKRETQRGGSTISQQVAKNLFLWAGKSYFRKGLEAYFTLLIEGVLPKRRILEIYLNTVEFAPGVFGVDAASHIIFRKTPKRLHQKESAILAAVLPNPLNLSAKHPSPYVLKRASQIIHQINRLGGSSYLEK